MFFYHSDFLSHTGIYKAIIKIPSYHHFSSRTNRFFALHWNLSLFHQTSYSISASSHAVSGSMSGPSPAACTERACRHLTARNLTSYTTLQAIEYTNKRYICLQKSGHTQIKNSPCFLTHRHCFEKRRVQKARLKEAAIIRVSHHCQSFSCIFSKEVRLSLVSNGYLCGRLFAIEKPTFFTFIHDDR